MGRSAILVDDVILLDYGMKPTRPPQFPYNGIRPESVIVSHAHLDHAGIVANLMDLSPEVYMTSVTMGLTHLLARDTIKIGDREGYSPFTAWDLQKLIERTTFVPYNERFRVLDYEVELFDAGHIPGSAFIFLDGEIRLFYTGDVKTEDTYLLKKAETNLPDADILIIESTYFGKEHPDRKELEKSFIESVKETLDRGGNAIVPCFAIGRTQEIVMMLHSHGITPYVDGMGLDALKIIKEHPSFLRDGDALVEAFSDAHWVASKRRKNVLREPSVVVTTAGMLNGGPVLYYLKKIYGDPKSKVFLTGYQVEGTGGRTLLEKGYIEANGSVIHLKGKVEQYDFSAHSDDSELKKIAMDFCKRGVQYIFPVHGENTKEFADWINENLECEAISPENGEEFIIE
ncbi:MAG: MBL fold metallo-hydrolase [Candidatus Syntropharchaeia archaeon]